MHRNIDNTLTENRRRVLAPDYDGFEAFYGCPVPSELRRFYDLKERLLAGILYATVRIDNEYARFDFIQYPAPMDCTNWKKRYGRDFFQFATNTDGYPLLIRPELFESPVFADFQDYMPTPYIEELPFTLEDIVGTMSNSP